MYLQVKIRNIANLSFFLKKQKSGGAKIPAGRRFFDQS